MRIAHTPTHSSQSNQTPQVKIRVSYQKLLKCWVYNQLKHKAPKVRHVSWLGLAWIGLNIYIYIYMCACAFVFVLHVNGASFLCVHAAGTNHHNPTQTTPPPLTHNRTLIPQQPPPQTPTHRRRTRRICSGHSRPPSSSSRPSWTGSRRASRYVCGCVFSGVIDCSRARPLCLCKQSHTPFHHPASDITPHTHTHPNQMQSRHRCAGRGTTC